jgi:enamine deaminase RidA (YjgF/YER057c/UK114 family)
MNAINPESLGAPKGYSHGMLAPAGGRVLFVAGQVGWDRDEEMVSERFTEQFAQALRNIRDVVHEAGGELEHIGRFTIYVTDHQAYLDSVSEVGAAYRSVMGKHFPAMALVEIQALLEPGALVEIEATAVLPG